MMCFYRSLGGCGWLRDREVPAGSKGAISNKNALNTSGDTNIGDNTFLDSVDCRPSIREATDFVLDVG